MTIATRIKNDLHARIISGRVMPENLTLESVAGHYQVSVTPVRTAVNQLVEEGVLTKGANRRLKLANENSVPVNGSSPLAVTEPPRDLVEVVSNDLVHLSLEGVAVRLREEATSEKYDVGRSVIRSIFHRLAGEGLLEHVPRRGWVLRPFRQEDMQSFLEIREVLELKALNLSRPRLRPEELQRMLDGNQIPKSTDEPPLIDNTLHAYLIDRAGNPYIKDFLDRHGRYYNILFDWEDQDRETAVETVRQHREILESLLERNWRAARKALSWHIQCNHPILSKILSRQSGNGRHAATSSPSLPVFNRS